MSCQIVFLDVGNADSIIIFPDLGSAIVIDMPNLAINKVSEWLEKRKITHIESFYFTHNHSDHLLALCHLKTFLEDWLLKSGTIKTVYLPSNYIKNGFQKKLSETHKKAIFRDAFDQLQQWNNEGLIKIVWAGVGSESYYNKSLILTILHPNFLFSESSEINSISPNEMSLVLKAEAGKFTALFLADIEGKGITQLLRSCKEDKLKAKLVKIPHHGAWPNNGSELKNLLEKIDAEIAIISVGSTNQYGHVAPETFQILIDLKNNPTKRLQTFLCTEVTRTCLYSISERNAMEKSGLNQRRICAGDIVIAANDDGTWEFLNKTDHDLIIQKIDRAACLDRAELTNHTK